MARPRSTTLTDGELRIMSVLWQRGPSSAQEITESLHGPRVTRSSVMTLLSVLERKGFVRHEQRERTYIFAAILNAESARRDALDGLLSRFFGGSVDALMASLADVRSLSANELQRARRIVEAAEKRSQPHAKRRRR